MFERITLSALSYLFPISLHGESIISFVCGQWFSYSIPYSFARTSQTTEIHVTFIQLLWR